MTMAEITADEIRELRADLNLEQDDLAALVGVTTQAVASWEAGHPPPTFQRDLMAAFRDAVVETPEWHLSAYGPNVCETMHDQGVPAAIREILCLPYDCRRPRYPVDCDD